MQPNNVICTYILKIYPMNIQYEKFFDDLVLAYTRPPRC